MGHRPSGPQIPRKSASQVFRMLAAARHHRASKLYRALQLLLLLSPKFFPISCQHFPLANPRKELKILACSWEVWRWNGGVKGGAVKEIHDPDDWFGPPHSDRCEPSLCSDRGWGERGRWTGGSEGIIAGRKSLPGSRMINDPGLAEHTTAEGGVGPCAKNL